MTAEEVVIEARVAGLLHVEGRLAVPVTERYIGLMSGTSLDGADGVLASFDSSGRAIDVEAHAHIDFPAALRAELFALNTSGADELHRAALAANALARLYAKVVEVLLAKTSCAAADVTAIGAHGQTVRHRPGEFDGIGYTWQLNAPALLAELTSIDVVAGFRDRDIAAGGQGAPLVPAFHRAVFGRADESVAVLNLGGVANLSVLTADGRTTGFDCGPANALLDGWCETHTGAPYDKDGAWAAGGRVDAALLSAMRSEPFFTLPAPKSTGRDLFNPEWLANRLKHAKAPPRSPMDVQATLAQLTAEVVAEAIDSHAGDAVTLLVCGGGAFNGDLMRRIERCLPAVKVRSTSEHGLPADQVEAAAFAWLARMHVLRRASNLPAVTGAAGQRVLGALYPGPPANPSSS